MSHDLAPRCATGAGAETPLDLFTANHRRVQARVQALRSLAPQLAAHGPDPQVREAALALLRGFDHAVREQHEDEERLLFPALLESMAGSDAVCLRELTDALTADHRALEQHWRRLRSRLDQAAPAAEEVQAFVGLYEQHFAREGAELLPMAARLLDDAALEHIGLALRARRGAIGADASAMPAD
jgi:iron-sulfur cluster repair protein YtfE (RIC family)